MIGVAMVIPLNLPIEPLPLNQSVPDAAVIPVLAYPDVREAVDWLVRVFGFSERLQIADHRAQMTIGPGAMIVAEYIDRDQRPVRGSNHVSHSTRVRIPDVQSHYEHVLACGGEILEAPADHVYGERQYVVRDIGGHRWTFSETLRDVHPNEWGNEEVVLNC